MPEIDNEASFQHALRTGISLMLGAGFSVLARNAEAKPLPVGSMLADELRDSFHVDGLEGLSLPQLYTVLAARDPDGVRKFLTERYSVQDYDGRYNAIPIFPIKTVFTTNIDDLIPRIYSSSITHYLNDLLTSGPVYRDRAAIDYIALHGSVQSPERPYRFSTLEVASSFNSDPTLWHTLRQRLSSSPTLFWGYSLQDAAALEAIQSAPGVSTHGATKWIVLRPSERHDSLVEYFRAIQFRIIFSETDELLDYLNSVAPQIVRHESREQIVTRGIEQYLVPNRTAVSQRPIADFYAGAAPAWSDIFRDDLHRFEQYRVVEEHIVNGSDVVISGIPASGKTTLLMQLAASGVGNGSCLVLEAASVEEVERLLRLLDGSPATVFMDNICDEIEAFNVLRAATNIVAVGAERDYYLSTAIHRVDSDGLHYVSVSELTQYDLGAIRARIPAAIRTQSMNAAETTKGLPSVLEFNLANTTSRSLVLRLEDALERFQRDDPQSAEMLILVSYVHSCRTVLSLDMALGYWRDEIGEWTEVVTRIEAVGKLLSEYEGDLVEDDQDYYAARSMIVADAAVKSAASATLRTVLKKFHYNLPIARICRYGIFKRRGYNHAVIGPAFPNTDEAVEFYDFLFTKEMNPYILQQKALLLSRRKRFAESFVEIDRALGMISGRNWTIEATHAQLLLNANLPLSSESSDARRQADTAMRILRTCYFSDRRRSLHAFRFARSAIEYFDIFGDRQSSDYLVQAREWLELVEKREPFMTQTKYVLRDVNRRLR